MWEVRERKRADLLASLEIYRMENGQVWILRVMHGRRDHEALFGD